VGPVGATGLDYVAVWGVVGRALGIRLSGLKLRFLQALEADQLREWAEAAKPKK